MRVWVIVWNNIWKKIAFSFSALVNSFLFFFYFIFIVLLTNLCNVQHINTVISCNIICETKDKPMIFQRNNNNNEQSEQKNNEEWNIDDVDVHQLAKTYTIFHCSFIFGVCVNFYASIFHRSNNNKVQRYIQLHSIYREICINNNFVLVSWILNQFFVFCSWFSLLKMFCI